MIFVNASTVTLFVLAVIGCARFTMDFSYDWFIVGGYAEKALDYSNRHYGSQETGFVGLYTKRADYWEHRDKMDTLLEKYEAESYVQAASVTPNWWTAHWDWVNYNNRTVDSSESFGWSIASFLVDEAGQSYRTKVVLDETSGAWPIVAAAEVDSQWFLGRKNGDASDRVEEMQDCRELIRDAAQPLDPVVYNSNFVWIEGFAIVIRETLLSISIACAVVFATLIVLLGDLRAATLVASMVGLVCVVTIGSIYWYNDNLNSISAFFIIIAVGLSSDVRFILCPYY